jgi:hypothetical protein
MSAENARRAQKIEAFLITMERLCVDMRDVTTSGFEGTMNGSKVTAAKDALTVVEDKLAILHTKMAEALATSSDADVVYRSGGGGGK